MSTLHSRDYIASRPRNFVESAARLAVVCLDVLFGRTRKKRIRCLADMAKRERSIHQQTVRYASRERDRDARECESWNLNTRGRRQCIRQTQLNVAEV